MYDQSDSNQDISLTKSLHSLRKPAHALSSLDVSTDLGVDQHEGLTSDEASRLVNQYGRNELGADRNARPFLIVIRQVTNAMTLVLILAMVASFAIRSWIEGGVVAAVILLNISIGFWQEFKAEKTMSSLRSLTSPTARVIRDGESIVVPAVDVVPGDVAEFKTGDTLPADIRLIEALNLEVDEALLTGESLPVLKNPDAVLAEDTGAGDRVNVVYSSSTVTKGRGRGIVFATGLHTEIGAIAAALQKTSSRRKPVQRNDQGKAGPHRYAQSWGLTIWHAAGQFLGVNTGTPLQRKLARLAILLFWIAVVCAIIVLAVNEFSSKQEVIIYAVATGLSMMPASLIVVLTIAMASGTKRMAKRHAIVRNLTSLEALGAVTDICSDKTGTLTQGKMIAKMAWIPSLGTYSVVDTSEPFNPTSGDVWFANKAPTNDPVVKHQAELITDKQEEPHNHDCFQEFLKVAVLANVSTIHQGHDGVWHGRGDPTELAINVFASRFDRTKLCFADWTNLAELPFDSDVKKMSSIYEDSDSGTMCVFTKGAVERVLDSCTYHYTKHGHYEEITDEFRTYTQMIMQTMAAKGLRVLALASSTLAGDLNISKEMDRNMVELDLVFRGLIGIFDPPRPESAGAVEECRRAGIEVRMLTGDHLETARAIAREVGILLPHETDPAHSQSRSLVMTATDLDKLSNDEIDALPNLPLVVARCAPHTKVRMIEALHRRERFCAMTGDGVNDSPSLKKANVGIAMGQSGSDVAKDASDIVLTDDNFASIISAIEEGRRMFDNIQKFILHLLAENVALALILLIGLAFKDSRDLSVFPLAPVEIMWIIMITSGFPDMGLGFDAAAPEVMKRPPQSWKKGVFTIEVMVDMVFYGLWIAILCLGAFLLVMFGFGDGHLGENCNDSYSLDCDTVFRARATTFASFVWSALFLAWELVHSRNSFFCMQPDSTRYFTQWWFDVRRNKFLFWSIVFGFITVFPTLYIPVVNRVVFKHEGITWEWGIVFVVAILFFVGAEGWKWGKRAFCRRMAWRQSKIRGVDSGAGGEKDGTEVA